jgi:hypothetical protein
MITIAILIALVLSLIFNLETAPDVVSTGATSTPKQWPGELSGVVVKRAKDISRAIVLDHTQGLHGLSSELTSKFHRLVQERVKFCRLLGGWVEVIEWCDLLLTFVAPSDNATKVHNIHIMYIFVIIF